MYINLLKLPFTAVILCTVEGPNLVFLSLYAVYIGCNGLQLCPFWPITLPGWPVTLPILTCLSARLALLGLFLCPFDLCHSVRLAFFSPFLACYSARLTFSSSLFNLSLCQVGLLLVLFCLLLCPFWPVTLPGCQVGLLLCPFWPVTLPGLPYTRPFWSVTLSGWSFTRRFWPFTLPFLTCNFCQAARLAFTLPFFDLSLSQVDLLLCTFWPVTLLGGPFTRSFWPVTLPFSLRTLKASVPLNFYRYCTLPLLTLFLCTSIMSIVYLLRCRYQIKKTQFKLLVNVLIFSKHLLNILSYKT